MPNPYQALDALFGAPRKRSAAVEKAIEAQRFLQSILGQPTAVYSFLPKDQVRRKVKAELDVMESIAHRYNKAMAPQIAKIRSVILGNLDGHVSEQALISELKKFSFRYNIPSNQLQLIESQVNAAKQREAYLKKIGSGLSNPVLSNPFSVKAKQKNNHAPNPMARSDEFIKKFFGTPKTVSFFPNGSKQNLFPKMNNRPMENADKAIKKIFWGK